MPAMAPKTGMNRPLVSLLLVLATGLVTSACAGGSASGGATPAATPGVAPAGPSTEGLEALYRARKDSALLQVSQADVDFITGMIGPNISSCRICISGVTSVSRVG